MTDFVSKANEALLRSLNPPQAYTAQPEGTFGPFKVNPCVLYNHSPDAKQLTKEEAQALLNDATKVFGPWEPELLEMWKQKGLDVTPEQPKELDIDDMERYKAYGCVPPKEVL